ncbi:MAG TPA: hypothetical protein VGF95_10100 [Solirubrobacteraceae bacterium]
MLALLELKAWAKEAKRGPSSRPSMKLYMVKASSGSPQVWTLMHAWPSKFSLSSTRSASTMTVTFQASSILRE